MVLDGATVTTRPVPADGKPGNASILKATGDTVKWANWQWRWLRIWDVRWCWCRCWNVLFPLVSGLIWCSRRYGTFHPRTEGKENFYPSTAPTPAMCMVCYDLIDSVMHIAKRKTRINRKILYYTPLCVFFFMIWLNCLLRSFTGNSFLTSC